MNAEIKNGINLLMILVLFISCVQEKEDNNVLRLSLIHIYILAYFLLLNKGFFYSRFLFPLF